MYCKFINKFCVEGLFSILYFSSFPVAPMKEIDFMESYSLHNRNLYESSIEISISSFTSQVAHEND